MVWSVPHTSPMALGSAAGTQPWSTAGGGTATQAGTGSRDMGCGGAMLGDVS